MKSPFAIFRKNQKMLMVVLTLLAIFAFVFLDSIGRSGASRAFGGRGPVVKINTGDLDAMAMRNLQTQRELANMFLRRAFEEVNDLSKMNRFQAENQLRAIMFNFGLPPREDVVIGHLLRQEADKLGIVVTDEAVEDYLDRAFEQKLSTEQFRKILRELDRSRKAVFDAIRNELQARLAFRMQVPVDPQSPDQYWKFYQQLKVEAQVALAAVPVKAFVSEVEDPSEQVLRTYFDKAKDRYGDVPPEYLPGFKQPRRVRLQYLGATYEAVEKLVPEVTDADVEAYYEQHKQDYVEREIPLPAESKPIEPEITPDNEKAPAKPEDAKKEDVKPAPEEKPAAPEKPAAEKPAAEKPEAEEDKGTDKKPEAGQEQGAARGRRVDQLAGAVRPQSFFAVADDAQPAQPAAADKPAADAKKPDADAKPSADEKPPVKDEQAPPKQEKAPAAAPKAETETEVPAAEAGKTDKTAAPALPAPKYRPLDDSLRATIRDQILRERTTVAMKEVAERASDKMTEIGLKYNSPAAVDGFDIFIDINGDGKRDDDEPFITSKQRPKAEELTPEQHRLLAAEVRQRTDAELQQVARELGMSYGQTELVSAEELSKLPGLGQAVEMGSNEFDPRGVTRLIDQMFSDESLYRPMRAEDSVTQDLFVAWKVQEVPAHVPVFTDPGIKEAVLLRWKMQQGQELAAKRAAELAKQVSGDKNMSEALKGQTVTGDPKSLELTVSEPPKFTWMHASAAQQPNPMAPQPPPELSNVPTVENPGDEFMEEIFDKLQPGQAGAAPNADRTIYYVVKVLERVPSAKEMEDLRAKFYEERTSLFGFSFMGFRGFSTPYQDLADQQQQVTVVQWVQGLEKKYGVKWIEQDESQE